MATVRAVETPVVRPSEENGTPVAPAVNVEARQGTVKERREMTMPVTVRKTDKDPTVYTYIREDM